VKKLLTSLVLSSALALAALPANAATTLKFAHAAPVTDLQQNLATFFAEELSKRTNGEVTVQIFPQGQLGNDNAMIDGARAGIIDIVMSGLNNFSGLMPESAALTLPFMFPNREVAYSVLDGDIGQGVLAKFEEHGLKGLGFPENGYRNMTNNRGPIRTPEDVRGLRMRVNSSKALNDMFELLGAQPQQIPVAELYTALEVGVVDSQDHPIGVTLSFKFYEVQKYLSLTQHAYAPLAIAMNLESFNALTAEQQQIVLDVSKEAVDMQRQLSIDSEDKMIAELEAKGMKVNRDIDSAAFQAVVAPVWDAFTAENGDTLVKAIQAETAGK
jgi:tripartite ATP-independent transporter DctP family solute receptor